MDQLRPAAVFLASVKKKRKNVFTGRSRNSHSRTVKIVCGVHNAVDLSSSSDQQIFRNTAENGNQFQKLVI